MGATTHDLDLGPEQVTKVFTLRHGDEAEREWVALTTLARHAPGLAPAPLEQHLDATAPSVVMSRVPGEPLGARPLTDDQLDALATALRRLHTCVPEGELARLPPRRADQGSFVGELRSWADEHLPHGPDAPDGDEDDALALPAPVVAALAAGRAWLGGPEADELALGPVDLVFSHGDGNVANLLWDGEHCRVVDFEDAGVSDSAYELADLLEHVSVWPRGILRPEDLLARLDLSDTQVERVRAARRLFAVFWLLMLLPGNPGAARNPAGTLERQAGRLIDLLRST